MNLQARSKKSGGDGVAKAAKKAGSPLPKISNPLAGGDKSPKKAGKSIANKASKTANKASAKVGRLRFCMCSNTRHASETQLW